MDLIAAFAITFLFLVSSVFEGIFLAYPLTAGILLFFLVALRRGFAPKDIMKMGYTGGKKSLIVVRILMLIGVLIPMWMASGTIPAIVNYGMEMIRPDMFVLSAFLLSCFVSCLIGTSVGTSGVVGTALMVMARSGGVNLAATAGAVIAGAYFGDRCSPVSSSASFVAAITETNIYDNIRNMIKTCILPFVISAVFYLTLSMAFPLRSTSASLAGLISKQFDLNPVVLVPAVIIILFSVLKVGIKISMLVSIKIALILSLTLQHQSLADCVKYMIFGFSLDASNPLSGIIKGGGEVSLLKTALVVFLASAFAGIMEGTGMLKGIENITLKADTRYKVFRNMFVTSLFGSVVGCSQTFAVMLTHMLNKKAYEKNGLGNSCEAIDLENTAIMTAALIPWNIALLAPMTVLGADASCIPYLVYIYLLPLWNMLFLKLQNSNWERLTSYEYIEKEQP
jgi:Na+:H+ antiporter, NhaC family